MLAHSIGALLDSAYLVLKQYRLVTENMLRDKRIHHSVSRKLLLKLHYAKANGGGGMHKRRPLTHTQSSKRQRAWLNTENDFDYSQNNFFLKICSIFSGYLQIIE